MTRKPLYVDGEQAASIRLDGPSLLVTRPGTASRRYPFSRVSRIITSGKVEWDSAALVACFEHGVTVTLLSSDGVARGFGLPASDPASRDSQRLEEFLSRGDWKGLYDNWTRSYERREILHLMKLLNLRLPDLRPHAVTAAVEETLCRETPDGFARHVKMVFDGLLASRVAEHAGAATLAPAMLVDRRPGFHFLRDWIRILGWRLYHDTQTFLGNVRTTGCGEIRPEVVRRYERVGRREDRRIVHYLDSFRFWLGGLR